MESYDQHSLTLDQRGREMTTSDYRDPAAAVDERVADLLGRMTIDEKVAQLGAIWLTQLVTDDAFDEDAADRLLVNGIGQITRIGSSTGLLPEGSASLMNQIQRGVVERTRLGIPVLVHEEAVGGFTHRGATTFPQALGLAATWDPELMGEVADTIRTQMLAVGARLALSPVLDVARDPRWGRVEETYGESPELCARMGVAYVKGLQTPDLANGVACAAKHFLAYGASIGGRNQAPVHVGPRELREVYACPFAVVIREAGLAGIMNSYSSVDGLPCAGSNEILTELLREELGFAGVVVADYFAVGQLLEHHRTAANRAEAAAQALAAGLDVELPALDYFRELPGLVGDGRLSEATLDLAVERVLRQKFRLGLFERPYIEPSRATAVFDTPEQRRIARRAAAKGVCLLANDGVLPLRPSELRSIAVIGPHADDIRLLQGDYHYPAHLEIIYANARATISGSDVETVVVEPDREDHEMLPAAGGSFQPGPHFTPHVSPLDGLRAALGGGASVTHVRGCHHSDPDDREFDTAVAVAAAADVAIVFVGAKSGLVRDCTSGELRDAVSLDLPGAQTDLVEVVAGTGTPTIVVIVSGRVHTLNRVLAVANAVLWSPLPGEEGGNGIADILTGEVNPSGRLPVTLPRHVGQLPLHHDMRARGDRSEFYGDYIDCPRTPLFPFGHGLSYTTFDYGQLRIDAGTTSSDTVVEVAITNVGQRAGEEVVQLYCRDDVASVARPSRELIGFVRVDLEPGGTARVTFTVAASRLAFYDRTMQRVTEPGAFTFFVGASAGDIRAEGTVEISGDVTAHALRDLELTSARWART
jgi:beta-glucosidase